MKWDKAEKCSEQVLSWKRSLSRGCFPCDHLALTAPVSRDMLPGQSLVPGALQVLGTDRKKCPPGDARKLERGGTWWQQTFPRS